SATTVTVTPATIPGSASGSSTLATMVKRPAPIAWAAWTTSRSTSRSDVSTSRAKNGTAPTVSGTTTAAVPIVVPTTSRVNGMIAIISTMNGTDRPTFTITPSADFSAGSGRSPSRSNTTSATPSGSPSSTVSSADQPTM